MKVENIQQGEFTHFLSLLDPSPDKAAEKYISLHDRLRSFFLFRDRRELLGAEDLADETIDRVISKIREGTDIHSIGGYILGIARNVAREALRLPRKAALNEAYNLPVTPELIEYVQDQSQRNALERALELLQEEDKEVLLDYYGARPAERIKQRRRLARKLGISTNNLRQRVHRLRKEIEKSMREVIPE